MEDKQKDNMTCRQLQCVQKGRQCNTTTKPPGRREEIKHVGHTGEQAEETAEEKEADKVAMSGIVKGKRVVMTSIYYMY